MDFRLYVIYLNGSDYIPNAWLNLEALEARWLFSQIGVAFYKNPKAETLGDKKFMGGGSAGRTSQVAVIKSSTQKTFRKNYGSRSINECRGSSHWT